MSQNEVTEMRSNMAGFKGRMESYDSQLSEVKRSVGDARQEVTQVETLALLLQKNVSRLGGSLGTLQQSSKDMASDLGLLSAVRMLCVCFETFQSVEWDRLCSWC